MEGAGSALPPFLLSRKSRRFLGSAMGIAIANRKNRCDIGALSSLPGGGGGGGQGGGGIAAQAAKWRATAV